MKKRRRMADFSIYALFLIPYYVSVILSTFEWSLGLSMVLNSTAILGATLFGLTAQGLLGLAWPWVQTNYTLSFHAYAAGIAIIVWHYFEFYIARGTKKRIQAIYKVPEGGKIDNKPVKNEYLVGNIQKRNKIPPLIRAVFSKPPRGSWWTTLWVVFHTAVGIANMYVLHWHLSFSTKKFWWCHLVATGGWTLLVGAVNAFYIYIFSDKSKNPVTRLKQKKNREKFLDEDVCWVEFVHLAVQYPLVNLIIMFSYLVFDVHLGLHQTPSLYIGLGTYIAIELAFSLVSRFILRPWALKKKKKEEKRQPLLGSAGEIEMVEEKEDQDIGLFGSQNLI